MKLPIPTRAFRLRDCVVLQDVLQDWQDDVIYGVKGINCCRDYKSNLTDEELFGNLPGRRTEVESLLKQFDSTCQLSDIIRLN